MNLLPEAKKMNYKSAGKLPPLEIPPDLTSPGSDERYVVPDISPSGTATFSAYDKDRTKQAGVEGSSVLPGVEEAGVRMERSGTQRWLVVKGEPEDIWPVVKAFWQELGFIIKIELPEAGVMETDWAENRAKIPEGLFRNALTAILDTLYSTAERDKFRTRLERGEGGMTEIYISHRGMDEVMEGGNVRTVWQPRPPNPDLEAEMLSRLMMRFGVAEERARSTVASSGAAQDRARLREKGSILTVNEAFDRSWRRVGLALDRIGFTVEDRNRSQGIYYVRYVNPDEDSGVGTGVSGLFSKLAFWRDDDSSQPGQYRIQLSEADTGTDVKVLNKDGVTGTSGDSTRILKLLYEQLK